MSNCLQIYPDGGGGYCLESIDIALTDYYEDGEVTRRGFHPDNTSRVSGIPIYDEPPVNIFGKRIQNLHHSQCETKIIRRRKKR